MEPHAKLRKTAAAAAEPDMLTLVADDDGSAHAVPRAVAIRTSRLLAEMLEATDEWEDSVPVPTSGAETAAFAAYVSAIPAGGGGPGAAAAGGAALAAAPGPRDLAFPADEWKTAAFFMVASWMRMMADTFGAAVCGAASAAGNGGYEAIAAATRLTDTEAVLDPAVSPLLSMLPPEAVVALWCATVDARNVSPVVGWAEATLDPAARFESAPLLPKLPPGAVAGLWHTAHAHADSPVAKWAGAEMGSPQRQAQGWLVAGGDVDGGGKLVHSSKAAHVVIRPGTAVIRVDAFNGCTGMVSVLIPETVTRIGDYAFTNCSALPAQERDALRARHGWCIG